MTTFQLIKTSLLLNLLNWYRRNFANDIEDVISPLDETINQIVRHLKSDTTKSKTPCRKHYFASGAFEDCPDCGWSSTGVIPTP